MAIITAELDSILNAFLPGASHASYTGNTSFFLSIHTADPGTTGASEFSTGFDNVTRPAIAFGASSSHSASNTAVIDYTGMAATTITHIGLGASSSLGTFPTGYKCGGPLGSPITTVAGDTLRFAVGGVVVSAT